jgi:hypothetical protein
MMHPVIAGLSVRRRSELRANPCFAALSADRRIKLLDEVMRVRASLDSHDRLDAFDDQDQRMSDAAKLKGAFTLALAILGRHRRIVVDMIDGLADYHDGYMDQARLEERACRETLRRMLAIAERIRAEPQDDPRSRKRREVWLLRWALTDFDVKVVMTTPSKHGRPNYSLELIGLLAHPPITADIVRYCLQC